MKKIVVSKISFGLRYKKGFTPSNKDLSNFRKDLKEFIKNYAYFLQYNSSSEEDIIPTKIKVRAKQFND